MNQGSIIGNHIFIIEDDTVMQYVMKRIFSPVAHVTIFGDGRSAWEALQSVVVPDLIITDLNIPFINGRELLSRITGNAELRHVPVMIVSADSSPDAQFKCLLAGARDYVPKPFDPKELISRANHAINTARYHPSLLHA